MPAKLNYTDNLKDYLRIDPTIESDLVQELRAHIEDKSHELAESGMSEEEAKAKEDEQVPDPDFHIAVLDKTVFQGFQ